MATNSATSNGDRKKTLNVVVVGGSLGGLATGIALAAPPLSCNVTILERNPTELLHNQGAGIVAGGDTLSFFKRYDRCQRPIAVSSQRRHYLDKDGNVVHKEEMVQNMTSWDLAYYIMRANFDGVESDYCKAPPKEPGAGETKHLHGHKVTGLEDQGDAGVRVLFEKHGGEKGSMMADLVVGADGPGSTVRKIVGAEAERTYAGYCALRGTVAEKEGSAAAKEAFQERFAFFHGPGVQILAYLIPGANGSVAPGERLMNFVYYANFPAGSRELDELLTDADGTRHRVTLPPGKMRAAAWEERKRVARATLPPQFAELVCKTARPFAQAITDVPPAPRNDYWARRVVLVGDALAGFRPHTVASTSQAAFDAMCLADHLRGEIDRRRWKMDTMRFARFVQWRGAEMGRRSQHEALPLEEHIADRNAASVPRDEEVYPAWTWTKADEATV